MTKMYKVVIGKVKAKKVKCCMNCKFYADADFLGSSCTRKGKEEDTFPDYLCCYHLYKKELQY